MLFLSAGRTVSFVEQLGRNLKEIAMLEKYKSSGYWGKEGELKGVKHLQRQFTPMAIRQFGSKKKPTSDPFGYLKKETKKKGDPFAYLKDESKKSNKGAFGYLYE